MSSLARKVQVPVICVALFGYSIAPLAQGTWAQDDVTEGVATSPAPAKQPAPLSPAPQVEAPIKVRSVLVTTPVTVFDSNGEFVLNLEAGDFEVFDNGVPQTIQTFEIEQRPLAVVVLVQTNRALELLLQQAALLGPIFSSLMIGPSGRAAVVTYDDRVRVAQEFTGDPDALSETLSGLKAEGDKARLNDALSRAMQLLEQRPKDERRVVVALGDGTDSGSETDAREIIRRAASADVTIYGLRLSAGRSLLGLKKSDPRPSTIDAHVGRPTPPGGVPTPTAADNTYGKPIPLGDIWSSAGKALDAKIGGTVLDKYAEQSGGVCYSYSSKKALNDQLSKLAADIHSQYELAYVPNHSSASGYHQIEIRVKYKGMKVRARAGYFANP